MRAAVNEEAECFSRKLLPNNSTETNKYAATNTAAVMEKSDNIELEEHRATTRGETFIYWRCTL